MATTTQGEAAMTTITLTDIDADTVKSIIRNCHAPNEIETGFTPDPIHTMLEQHMIIDRSAVINAIADRFPVYCTHIVKGLDVIHYHFMIANAKNANGDWIRVHCDLDLDGFKIVMPNLNITSSVDAINFAKAINAITEWAVEAA
jgi:hypothetical protein